ncbi:PPOX class F420-dependent oxidoreductase [Nocardia sp. NPDC003345]
MTVEFDRAARELLDGRNFATVATLQPDGAPHTSVVWIERDGDTVQFSSITGRRKVRNLGRDNRISITVSDAANPYRSIDIQGTAELIEDPDKALPRRLSQKYLGQEPPGEADELRRFIVRVTPAKITGFAIPNPAAAD